MDGIGTMLELVGSLDMGRGAATFRKADVTRLIEAARAAGLKVTGVELTSTGTLRALEAITVKKPESEFDRWEQEL